MCSCCRCVIPEAATANAATWPYRGSPDVPQETKLQPQHVEDVEAALFDAIGISGDGQEGSWRAGWSCSTARKGYSGVCTLWAHDRLVASGYGMACSALAVDPSHEAGREGRALLLELRPRVGDIDGDVDGGDEGSHSGGEKGGSTLGLVNVYTPNSGAALARLDYRTSGWDARFREAVLQLRERVGAVCVGGDLNVAASEVDWYNPEEPRTLKQAGTTPEERASFALLTSPLVDTFRAAHPDAAGQYSYWSQVRANGVRNQHVAPVSAAVQPCSCPSDASAAPSRIALEACRRVHVGSGHGTDRATAGYASTTFSSRATLPKRVRLWTRSSSPRCRAPTIAPSFASLTWTQRGVQPCDRSLVFKGDLRSRSSSGELTLALGVQGFG